MKEIRGIGIVIGMLLLAACAGPEQPATTEPNIVVVTAAPAGASGGVPTPRVTSPVPLDQPSVTSVPDDMPTAEDVLPVYTLEIGGESLQGEVGGYCWPITPPDGDPFMDCITVRVPTFDPADRLQINASEPIRIILEEPLPDTLEATLQKTGTIYVYDQIRLDLAADPLEWTPEVEPGDYELVLYGTWTANSADIVVYYPLTITAGEGDSDAP